MTPARGGSARGGVPADAGRLLAVSDLHIGYPENRAYADSLAPGDPDDWLIVAGDVGEAFADVGFVLASLASRFATGDLDAGQPRAVDAAVATRWRCAASPGTRRCVKVCRRFGVLTPEDEFPVWPGPAAR